MTTAPMTLTELAEKEPPSTSCADRREFMAQGLMEVVYDYLHPLSGLRVAIRCRIARDAEEVPTISHIFHGANWHEREAHDFFGIRFAGHPNLTPFLLPEDATFHPLRKDYAGAPAE